jgi:biotin carboxyl carrier protein
VNFAVGDSCKKGDVLCVLEAMKMENEIVAPCGGKIASAISKDTTVNTGDLLFVIA